MIHFYLTPNALTPAPDSQSARILSNRILDTAEVIKEMLRRGTTVQEADINAVIKVLFEVVTDEVAEGNSVNLPLINIRPGITGNFNNESDTFDVARHTKRANITAGVLLQQKMAGALVQKVNRPVPAPVLTTFTDVNSGQSNAIATPTGIGRIYGEHLKFDTANPDEGVFFIDGDGFETKVAIMDTRTANRLSFVIPTLTPGSYTLEVRKAFGSTTLEIRKGLLRKPLQIS
jgi:hypothetical protein